jgi:hypothetical protein
MKKLLGILVLGLLWCNIGSAEEVYYCVDSRSAGYQKAEIDNKERVVNFHPEKFKIKFDDSTNSLIMIEDGYESTFKSYQEKYKWFYIDNFDDTIVFQPKKWEKNENVKHYVRSHTLPNDPLYVAQGKCEKF